MKVIDVERAAPSLEEVMNIADSDLVVLRQPGRVGFAHQSMGGVVLNRPGVSVNDKSNVRTTSRANNECKSEQKR